MTKHSHIYIFLALVIALFCSCNDFEHSVADFQKQLNEQEKLAMQTTDHLVASLLQNNSIDSLRFIAEQDHNALYYVYNWQRAVYWSTNWLATSAVYLSRYDQWSLRLFDNATVICRWTRAGQYNILTVIPIKYDYKFENRQLRNEYIKPFKLKDDILISQARIEGGIPVNDADGHYIFTLWKGEPADEQVLSADPLEHTRLSESFSYPTILSKGKDHAEIHREVYYYIFFTVIFFAILLAVGIYYIVRNHGFKNMQLRVKFQFIIVGLQLLTIVFVFIVSYIYVNRQYSERQCARLEEKGVYIQKILKDYYCPYAYELSPLNTPGLNIILRDLSYTYEVDIHVYDLQGNLIGTSLPQLFDFNILSTHMSPEPFFGHKLGIVKENIGGMPYLANYVEFLNGQRLPIGYIEIPYYVTNKDKHLALDKYLSRLLPPFLLMMIVAVVFGLILIKKLTRPLNALAEGMRNFKIGETNEHLKYNHHDEVGQLVDQYNQMVDELEESTHKLARSERESAWKTMARQVAHEINNPLTPMRLKIQQMQRLKQNEDPRFDAFFDSATEALIDQVDQLSNNAQAFSSFAKMPEVVTVKVDVAAKLSGVISLFKSNQQHIDIRYIGPDFGVVVKTDQEQIAQVFNNLIKNALQVLESKADGEIIIRLKDLDKTVEISISDNGPGVSEEIRDRIFMPNFTTKSTGSGLGLAISKNIVEGSGGKIWFDTSEKGTTFYIQLRK